MKKRGYVLAALALALLLVVAVAVVAGFFLLRGPAAAPVVLINSPRHGERVAVDQETIVQASARGDQRIKRVELWVDGQLQEAQTSSIAGGVTPFPIVVNWRPAISGTHTLVVRAYNAQNARGYASINVEAVQSGDRDGDSAPDALDACPDQPGLTTHNGCPVPSPEDRDGDGAPDRADLCPDQAGTLLAQGCPDADGDGVTDAGDRCPREAGTAERHGCPAPGDADGDGIPDASDACPSEVGSAALGGCPDRDGDTVRDRDDTCPDEPGLPGVAGCPDRDGDGVRDALDFCPDAAGPASNSGCPAAGPGGGDVPPPGGGGDSPPPGGGGETPPGGEDRDSDDRPDEEEAGDDPLGVFGFFIPDLSGFVAVEIQALEFQVEHDYSEVYCYATAGNTSERIGPFASLSGHRWDIAAFWGPLNSRTLFVPIGSQLQVVLDCGGIVYGSRASPVPGGGLSDAGGDDAFFDLGSLTRTHTIGSRMTEEVTVDSSGGESGHSFHAKYRVCSPACEPSALHAPMLARGLAGGQNRLVWSWEGNAYDISGFKLYRNGSFTRTLSPTHRNFALSTTPPCGHTFEYRLSAYRGTPGHPDSESVRSNAVTLEGPPCQRTVTVSFRRLETGDLHDNDDWGDVGPLFGTLYAGEERRSFESDRRLEVDDRSHDISDFFPRTDFAVELESGEPLVIGAWIKDRDPGRNPNDTIFDFQESIPAAQIVGGEHRLTGRFGSALVVYISVTPGY